MPEQLSLPFDPPLTERLPIRTSSVTVRAEWCMGHRLPNHHGLCSRLHGHQYAAEATVEGDINGQTGTSDEGMVLDFGDIKDALREIVRDLDHSFLLSDTDPVCGVMVGLPGVRIVSFVPTAENIAVHILEQLPEDVISIRVWETPTSFAEVSR